MGQMGQASSQPQPPPPIPLTSEQLQAKALRKAERRAERAAAREEASASDMEGEKRFPCPIEGCGKVYKQANGLKYHLTRSINSGHGNVAASGLAQFFTDKSHEG
jgi:transcription factor SFP1